MLENCDAFLNATAVYHQNHYCATRSALGKVSLVPNIGVGVYIRMAPWSTANTRGWRFTHRESVLLNSPHPPEGLLTSEDVAIWRIWRLIWRRLDKYSINYIAHRYLGEGCGGGTHTWKTNGYFIWDIHYFACSVATQEGKCVTFYWLDVVLNRN